MFLDRWIESQILEKNNCQLVHLFVVQILGFVRKIVIEY